MKVLVTGAAGRVGRAVVGVLVGAGYAVRGTDIRYQRQGEGEFIVADLSDRMGVYRLIEGCDAVVHLGNHPNLSSSLPPQQVYTENVTMNANVFQAAIDVGIKRVLFSSSIQAISGDRIAGDGGASCLAYLPIDGDAPACAMNLYALSKVAGEQMLRLYAKKHPELALTALRLPWVMSPEWVHWMKRQYAESKVHRGMRLDEGFAYLWATDVGRLVDAVLQRQEPGYHQYLPAAADMGLNMSPSDVAKEYYPGVEVRSPLEGRMNLVDISRITREVGWEPREPSLATLTSDA